ncbi:YdeI/OmpD-associated family protein [Paenibacillus sp. P22]|uniref:YdeI/OmpD-associated family protein n=1 Tax=Paenibacillus sp. P22 TaxID=483908 RepID=UPI002FC372AD
MRLNLTPGWKSSTGNRPASGCGSPKKEPRSIRLRTRKLWNAPCAGGGSTAARRRRTRTAGCSISRRAAPGASGRGSTATRRSGSSPKGGCGRPGLEAVDEARRSGRWDKAYESQSRMEMPGDFAAELERRPAARDFFAGLDSRNRYAMLYRVHQAQKPETRAARILAFADMLERGERIYPKK